MNDFKRKQHLKDYTDGQLQDILENNENLKADDLIFICSEVLRRVGPKLDRIFMERECREFHNKLNRWGDE